MELQRKQLLRCARVAVSTSEYEIQPNRLHSSKHILNASIILSIYIINSSTLSFCKKKKPIRNVIVLV